MKYIFKSSLQRHILSRVGWASILLWVWIAAGCSEDAGSGQTNDTQSNATDATSNTDTGNTDADDTSTATDGNETAADTQPDTTDPLACSGKEWTFGDFESPLMHPGVDCVSCHAQQRRAPTFKIAGTVFGRSNEPDDCYGTTGATIELTDSTGKVLTMVSNDAGNFYSFESLTPPYTAKILYQGQERAMTTAQTETSCNSCHTSEIPDGTPSASPGRILLPGVQ